MKRVAIIGAGISGISAAYHIQEQHKEKYKCIVFEKDSTYGGLCGGFYVDSSRGKFWFDNCVHLSFTSNEYVKQVFESNSKPFIHIPNMNNYYKGLWIKHPAQNNLYPLDVQTKVNILKDMINNHNKKDDLHTFQDWLKAQYGDCFTATFPSKYTRKYWTLEANELTCDWVSSGAGNRLYTPNLDEILYGAMSDITPNTYYAKEQRYPQKGGYRSFFSKLANSVDIKYNHNLTNIDAKNKILYFDNHMQYHYDILISSLPLNLMPSLLNAPRDILDSASKLEATSVAIISLGFNKDNIAKKLWFYVYDEDILFARVYSPSKKSIYNAPNGRSSLQAEVYFSRFKPLDSMIDKNELLNHTIDSFVRMGICAYDDIIASDVRIIKYGNVIFNKDIHKNKNEILNYLKLLEIHSIGRFGKWEYLWSDESFLSGKEVALKI